MSAESPRRGVHKGAQIVSPQPIVDRSIIDNVAGIINDIVPQGYAGVSNSDNKETISWARFEYADINDPALYPDYNEGSGTPPLLLVLGYATGVQVWLITATGEATEVLSWRQGVVRTLRMLPNPTKTDDEHVDPFEAKRPMVAICDSAGPGPQFCHISFISLKTGEQVKSIKFKNPVCDVLANKRSVVVTFLEKIAVFDARTLEDVITITTCYASPGPNPNPVALGTRWLAYSEKKLLPARRSSGGCEGEGVQSYTATVLYAAKSLGKGLRGLGETVASSLTGNSVSPMVINNIGNDITQPGVITILDLQAAKEEKELDDANIETVIAHFTAHSDAIVAMTFDLTGALLMTADKRGHDFHVFRIQPHPGGPTLAAVHHLYILHRGDTTAKVQDMVFSSDTRWAAVSTVRGTTHVFPVAPYGGPVGVRTHSTPHVVNRLSRFHKSAGLTDDGTRSHSPVSHAELPLSVYPYSNPRLPPYPHPTILHPLSQIRQPSSLNHVNSSSQPSRPQQRQRLYSDDSGTLPLKICVCFAPPRAWMYAQRESSSKVVKRAVDSLFIMACHGNMIQYDLEPKPASGVPKEKVCDDTIIELEVEAKGQWPLLRTPNSSEIAPPLPLSSPLLTVTFAPKNNQELDTAEDRWLSQVEIVTHAGPHRRLWMGPQFVFKTYNAPSGVAVNLVEAEAVEIGITSGGSRPARSKPVNMPHASSRPLMPVVIDGSGSSYEQSPRFVEAYGDPLDSENAGGSCESQLREDLAEAMLEISIASTRPPGRRLVIERVGQPVTKVVNPLGTVITVSADEEDVSNNLCQELFDSAEEILAPPEAPRSVCAEEGPASLGDLEPPEYGCTLRDLTEICAEMRSASEPAIDSIPDESIRELKERRAVCAEILTITGNSGNDCCGGDIRNSSTIDFEREEAFHDVPTNFSLCVEPGEIPSSPMTRVKETVWYCKKSPNKRDEQNETCESSFANAKYVVNYDDNSVTLLENRTTTTTATTMTTATTIMTKTTMREKSIEEKQLTDAEEYAVAQGITKKSAKACSAKMLQKYGSASNSSNSVQKCLVAQPSHVEKYIIKEDKDSVIIEDVQRRYSTNVCAQKQNKYSDEKKKSDASNENTKNVDQVPIARSLDTSRKIKSQISAVTSQRDTRCGKVDRTRQNEEIECAKEKKSLAFGSHESERSTANKLSQRIVAKKNAKPSVLETKGELRIMVDDDNDDELPSLDPPPLDDFSSIEYRLRAEKAIVCPTGKDIASSSTHQSDDDIEHIHIDSEIMQIRETANRRYEDAARPRGRELSPVAQRKNSKSISDDDLEYIYSSELGDVSSERTDATTVKPDVCTVDCRQNKHALSSDDDLEHVQHSEIRELERASLERTTREISIEQKPKLLRSIKKNKDNKDNMVIENEAAKLAKVTVIYNPLEDKIWKSGTAQQEVDNIECGANYHRRDKPEIIYPANSPVRRTKNRASKTSSTLSPLSSSVSNKRISQPMAVDAVEIIDIDAMQKAEIDPANVPECRILSLRHDTAAVTVATAGTRVKKSRKNKKLHTDGQTQSDCTAELPLRSSKIRMAELQEAVEELLVAESKPKLKELKAQTDANVEISWSSIVKKNISSSDLSTESMTSRAKEMNLELLIGMEERSLDGEHVKKIPESSEFHDKWHVSSESTLRTAREQENARVPEPKDLFEEDIKAHDIEATRMRMKRMMEENLFVDVPAPMSFEDEEELSCDGDDHGNDIARETAIRGIKIRGNNEDKENRLGETTKTADSSLVSAEVVVDRRRRFVDNDDNNAETRRGNAAVKGEGESQESSLQLAASRWSWRRQQEMKAASVKRNINHRQEKEEPQAGLAFSKEVSAEPNRDVTETPTAVEKQSDLEERGEPLPEHSTSSSDEQLNNTTTFIAHTGGGSCLCCSLQDTVERNSSSNGGSGDNSGVTASLATVGVTSKKSGRSKRKKRR